jgi:2-C-methyl-D-erythritol 4-phosphate cytidylyltransferase
LKKAFRIKKRKSVVAIIAAAGEGKRLKSAILKVFVPIKNKPLLYYSLKAFSRHPLIESVILVCNSKAIARAKQLVKRFKFNKVSRVIAGGPTRKDSVANALARIQSDTRTFVLVHDAARPFISRELITRTIGKVLKNNATICAVPVKCTIKTAKRYEVKNTLQRKDLWEIQTPQGFRVDLLKRAYARYGHCAVTDDAALIEKMKQRVSIIMGSYANIKITTKEDLLFAHVIAKHFNWGF